MFRQWREAFDRLLGEGSVPIRVQWLTLALILGAGLSLRLLTIDAPALDRTLWKEIDYLQVAHGYWQGGYAFLHPTIEWPAEPPRVTAMELPLVPYLTALLYPLFGDGALVSRLVPLLSWLFLPLFLFRLARREWGPVVGLLAALGAMLMPLFHLHRNMLFSEPTMLAASVLALERASAWVRGGRKRDLRLSGMAFSLAVALKLTPLYLLLPLATLHLARPGSLRRRGRTFFWTMLAALVLPVLWFTWATFLGRSSLDVFGIFTGHDKLQTFTMLAQPEWYRTLAERILWDLLGGKVGLGLALTGLVVLPALPRRGPLLAWLGAIAAYFAIVAEGQIDAPYRQLSLVPPLAVVVAIGACGLAAAGEILLQRLRLRPRRWAAAPLAALFLLLLVPARNPEPLLRHDATRPAHPLEWAAAGTIREHAEPGDRLLTLGAYTIHKGGNDLSPLLYHYSGLRGWSLQSDAWHLERVEALRERGATHLAAWQMDREPESAPFLAELRARFPVLAENERLLLLDLR